MQLIKTAANKFSRVPRGLLCGGVLIFFLVGCAQVPPSAGAAAGKDEGAAELSQQGATGAADAPTSPAPWMDLKSIIRLIEAGQSDEAQRALKTYLAKDPKNSVALSLQQQLTVNPAVYLGKPATQYTVQSGDTLGGIAAKFLGNPLKFVILGRYNQISRVKDLRVGQVLKLPAKLKADSVNAPTEALEAAPPAQSAAVDVGVSAAPPVSTTAPAPAPASAPLEPNGVGTVALPGVASANLSPAQMSRVQKYHEAALVAYRKQDLDNAIALWNKALAIDPNYEPALGYRARAQELQRRLNQMGTH
ncbi:MAG: hypothetical protein B7Y53_00250 [Halothiobacillus sp. 28-55-5]|nr:MAG: hypothetical protein B7Y53_00250 [Halothiobacillus sp. 28-55-5]